MAQNRKQHFVQRAYLDGFADEAGGLLAYCKQRSRILNLGHPCNSEDILHGKNYYNDAIGDFDAAFNAPVENTFRAWYNPLTATHTLGALDDDAFGSFLLWVGNHLARTQYLASVVTGMRDGGGMHEEKARRNAFINLVRSRHFERWVRERRKSYWRTMHFPVPPRLVVSDNPVCETALPGTGRMAIVVPVCRDLIAIGGDPEVVERVFSLGNPRDQPVPGRLERPAGVFGGPARTGTTEGDVRRGPGGRAEVVSGAGQAALLRHGGDDGSHQPGDESGPRRDPRHVGKWRGIPAPARWELRTGGAGNPGEPVRPARHLPLLPEAVR